MYYECPLCKVKCCTQMDFKMHQHIVHPINKEGTADLFEVIKKMWLAMEDMKKMLQKQKGWVQRQRKRINYIEYLNTHEGRIEINFIDWCKGIKSTVEDFTNIFEETYDKCIMSVLKRNGLGGCAAPLRSFSARKNIIYVYKDNSWCKMTEQEFNQLFSICETHIYYFYRAWCDKNNDNNGLTEQTAKITQKICGGKGGLKSIRKKVRKQLYNYIKMSESNVYELDFIS